MKRKIRGTYKICLYDLIFFLPGSILAGIGVFFCLDAPWVGIVYGILLLLFLFYSFCDVQWIVLRDGRIEVFGILGLIKKENLSDIKCAVYVDAVVCQWQKFRKTIPCIAISTRRKIKPRDVDTASNRKKYSYIILPYTPQNRAMLTAAYREATDSELEITL